eukprot:TRINITY_DN36627_c0_g3_i1.p1 TRINITY_DN36627_c0_g3~~TRINITY_DN36627_c0_g3_i1.p1  ORF type:complete len:480 (-),score=56.43 TRINITY_DN36627_c0_g3_i1:175-1614(-)
MAPLWISVLAGCFILSLAGNEPCHCETPTPCLSIDRGANATCVLPTIEDYTICPNRTKDCRSSGQTLCEMTVRSDKHFCCWTACSSLAMKRVCGKAPHGFQFERPGIFDPTECHDPFNLREKCCLRQLHTQATLKAGSDYCPQQGPELAALFATVDGNAENPTNDVLSAEEVLRSLKWLREKKLMFIADHFHDIDSNHNHKLDWYELEEFCGHQGMRIPASNIGEVKVSNIATILINPLYVMVLISSLIFGELWGIGLVIGKHCLGLAVDEGYLTKLGWLILAILFPVSFAVCQWWYFFTKIDWEVCDSDGWSKYGFAFILALQSVIKTSTFIEWVRRRCPLTPSKDLERRAFLQQLSFHKWGWKIANAFKVTVIIAGVVSLYFAVRFGSLDLMPLVDLTSCQHEDPDMALLAEVNQKFILMLLICNCLISVYCSTSRPLQEKAEYERLPEVQDVFFPKELDDVNAAADRTKDRWEWFA